MDSEESVLQAVLAEPDSIEMRMVAADWYEEIGDPRAEFIRVQLGLSQLPRRHLWKEELQKREKQLFLENHRRWNIPVHRILNETELKGRAHARRSYFRGWQYHRGFVEQLDLAPDLWLYHEEMLRKLGPIRRIRFRFQSRRSTTANALAKLAESVVDLTHVDLRNAQILSDGLISFLNVLRESKHLRVLNLEAVELAPETTDWLCSESGFPANRLETLTVSSSEFSLSVKQQLAAHFGSAVRQPNGMPLIRENIKKRHRSDEQATVREIPYDDSIDYQNGHMFRDGHATHATDERYLPLRFDREDFRSTLSPWEHADDHLIENGDESIDGWEDTEWLEEMAAERYGEERPEPDEKSDPDFEDDEYTIRAMLDLDREDDEDDY